MGELIFDDNGAQKTAKWSHLVKLYQLESGSLVKLSKLNEVAITPKPVERQSVASCLRVFSDETVAGLLNHPGMKDEVGVVSTTIFINKVIIFWKIVNVKSLDTISDPNDPRLDTLLEFGAMCRKMILTTGKRVKQLTRDTFLAIHQTCNGLVELTRHLLSTTHKYVVLGKFTTDKLEKAWTCFCYIMFHTIKDNVCRESLSNILSMVAERYTFGVIKPYYQIFSSTIIVWSAAHVSRKKIL